MAKRTRPAKPKSPLVVRLDEIQSRIADQLKPLGFRKRGRTLRRETDNEVLQIIALQAGPVEIGPPSPEPLSHLRQDFFGKFTVNLGVYVPEIHARTNPPVSSSRVISDAYCSIRSRLGHLAEGKDIWWSIPESDDSDIDDITAQIIHVALPFLDRFGTRDLIVRDWVAYNERSGSNVARLDVAMILLRRGNKVGATQMFQDHIKRNEAEEPAPHIRNHLEYVRNLAVRLGLELNH